MANLKEIRNRIASVRSTQKITSAMKMVSAAKLRRTQNKIINLRPYANHLSYILSNLLISKNEDQQHPLEEVRNPERILIILITSNKGLCGGFNNAVIKETERTLLNVYRQQHQQKNVSFLCIGKKAADYVQKKKYPLIGIHSDLTDNCTFENVSLLAEEIMQKFISKEYDKVEVIFNRFKNAATQVLTNQTFLPLTYEIKKDNKQKIDFIFEPKKEEIYNQMIPLFIKVTLYRFILNSVVSEHGARMTAMHQATENAKDLIKDLNLTYNKVRQAAITNALIEMVSGAESLKNS